MVEPIRNIPPSHIPSDPGVKIDSNPKNTVQEEIIQAEVCVQNRDRKGAVQSIDKVLSQLGQDPNDNAIRDQLLEAKKVLEHGFALHPFGAMANLNAAFTLA